MNANFTLKDIISDRDHTHWVVVAAQSTAHTGRPRPQKQGALHTILPYCQMTKMTELNQGETT